MPTIINGTTGVDTIQDNTVTSAKIAAGAVGPDELSGAQTGSTPVYGCRAWCVFDGTTVGTNAPIAGGNVTNVTRNSAGDYTINFTTPMPDALYGITGTARALATNGVVVVPKSGGTLTGSAVQIITDRNTSGVLDSNLVSVAIFR